MREFDFSSLMQLLLLVLGVVSLFGGIGKKKDRKEQKLAEAGRNSQRDAERPEVVQEKKPAARPVSSSYGSQYSSYGSQKAAVQKAKPKAKSQRNGYAAGQSGSRTAGSLNGRAAGFLGEGGDVSSRALKQAVVWSEILGDPVARKRSRRRRG